MRKPIDYICVNKCPLFDNFMCKDYKKLGIKKECTQNNRCPYRDSYCSTRPDHFIQFGKYKFKMYELIPKSYLAWCLKQENLKGKEYIEDYILESQRASIIDEFIKENYIGD